MAYLRGSIAGVSAIFAALLFPGLLNALKGISEQKATGLGAVAGGVLESLFSPLFWILAVMLFVLLFAASRLQSPLWRAIFFWVPSVVVLLAGATPIAAFGYLWLRSRRG